MSLPLDKATATLLTHNADFQDLNKVTIIRVVNKLIFLYKNK